MRSDVLVHVAADVLDEQRIGHGFVDEAITAQEAEVGQREVAAVEQLDLHLLIGRNVVGELHADLFPGRPAGDKAVFQYPLHEGFADHRPGVIEAVLTLEVLAMRRAGHGRDAVDHGVGKADVALDPAGQVGVDQAGERQRGLAGHVAVVGEVVAGHHREGADTVAAALGQRRAEQTEHADRTARVLQVVLNLGQLRIELAGAVVQAIAALGDGQRDDANRRIGQASNHRLGTILVHQQHVANAADHPDLGVRPVVELDQGVEIVLRGQRVAHRAFLGACADAADAPFQTLAGVHQRIGVGRLVGAVKAAHADVGDAGGDLGQAVVGSRDRGRQLWQIRFFQLHLGPRWA